MIRRDLCWTWAVLLVWAPAVLAATSPSSTDRLQDARGHADAGRLDQAMDALGEVLRADPDDAEGRLLEGVLLARSGRTGEARLRFLALKERFPEMPEVYNNLAVLQTADRDDEAAFRTLRGALLTFPVDPTILANLTRLNARLLAPESAAKPLQLTLVDRIAHPVRRGAGGGVGDALGDAPVAVQEPLRGTESQHPAPVPPIVPPRTTAVAPAIKDVETAGQESAIRPLEHDLARLVIAWARAWEEQRVDDYLAFYAPDFGPPRWSDREAWETERRRRVASPEFIELAISELAVEAIEGKTEATAVFVQTYASDRFRDTVIKKLVWRFEDGEWRIVAETLTG